MAVTTTNLGVITAYGDAVAAGYTGTKAEWQALMASYATVGQQAVDAKNDAVAAKNTAVSKATEATTAASTATTKANEASASAQSIAQSAAQIQENTDSIDQLKSEITDKSDTADMLKAFPTDTASGSVASFADGANVPVKSLTVNIDPVQSGSGDPSPDNVRPISGWSEVNVHRTRKNLFDVHFDNTISSNSYSYVLKLKPNTQYTCSSDVPLSTVASVYFGGGSTNVNGVFDGTPKTMTTDANGNIAIYIRHITSDGGINMYQALLNGTHWIQVEEGATATPYEPYSGQSITIDLGQTVYGGKLDVTKGELVIDRAMITLSTLNWSAYNAPSGNIAYPYLQASLPDNARTALVGEVPIICSSYKCVSSSLVAKDGYDKTIAQGTSQLFVSDSAYSDRASFLAGIADVQLVYMLANPITIQLTPHEVTTLLGSNNVWADSGDSEVTYRADPTLYIQRLTEPDADMVADANITSGQYFMVGNTLYKATANIASGGEITPNVNCTRKSLSEALNELNA